MMEYKIFSAARHFLDKLQDAPISETPFERFYFDNPFPAWYYDLILAHLPADAEYTDRTFEHRMMVRISELDGEFWRGLGRWMHALGQDIVEKFKKTIDPQPGDRFSTDVRLVRDKKGYLIKPHTDIKAKAVSLLFYLPDPCAIDSLRGTGTEIMVPKDRDFTSDGTNRFKFEDFETVWSAPFLPNTVLGFPRSNVSFHGLHPIEAEQRDVLLLNIYRMKRDEASEHSEEY